MRSTTMLGAVALLFSSALVSAASLQPPRQPYKNNDFSIYGCYSSPGELTFSAKADFQDNGNCARNCRAKLKQVGATVNGTDCWCGDHYPPKSTLAEDSKCNRVCTGFQQACGGFPDGDTYFFTVSNSGLVEDVSDSPDPSTTGSPSPTKSGDPTNTVVVTEPPKSSGASPAGIAAGVVVSVVVVGALIGAGFWYMRRKRNREIEDEHQRAAAINNFVNGRGPGNASIHSLQDSRLDPVMAQHRLSSGSIADNQDYSRKILRVTNA